MIQVVAVHEKFACYWDVSLKECLFCCSVYICSSHFVLELKIKVREENYAH